MELNCHSIKGNKMYLVQYRANYADEFDVYGFAIYNQELMDEFNEACEKVRNRYRKNSADFSLSHYFGSNEEIIFNTAEEVSRAFNVRTLTSIDVQTLSALFRMDVNGTKGLFFELAERVSDWEE